MQAGDKLSGRYALEKRLDGGGMGVVWLGLDEWLDRPVAVKVLREEQLAHPAEVARFRREATIGARLQHPGFTVVHDVGVHNGQLFIIMEWLRGCDLKEKLAGTPAGLPVDEAVSLILQAAEALKAAHAIGFIHRDLKPANLFLLESGQLKICDFGIARAVDSTTHLTALGYVVGSAPYMSPEQCQGERVDKRSDLYSLGCVLYALLTGRPPFAAGEPLAIMNLHVNAAPKAPRTIRAEIPTELDRLIVELLAKDPARRPADASHVITALQALRYTPTVKVELNANSAAGPDPGSPGRTGHGTGIVRNGPDRAARRIAAARLIAAMERYARSIRDHAFKAKVLAEIATALAATRPDDAERLALLITGVYWRATTLPGIARALTATGPDRAARLIAAAERDVLSIAEKSGALAEIAKALAAIDPDRAERTAGSIGNPSLKATVLAEIAAAQASTDPVRAARLMAASEHTVWSVPGESSQLYVLAEIAKVLAVADPDRAERIARSIANESSQAHVLAEIAKVLAAAQPIHAERIARSVADKSSQASTLAEIAKALAATDPVRAEHVAGSIEGPSVKARALAEIAAAQASTDPVRAARLMAASEHIARSITSESSQAHMLAEIAKVLAVADPDRAERIARSVADESSQAYALAAIANVLAATDPVRAARLAADAEYLAQFIGDERSMSEVLAEIAFALAVAEPDRAERIARSVADPSWQARLAMAVAATEPDRAERILRSIKDTYWWAWTSMRLVEAWSGDV